MLGKNICASPALRGRSQSGTGVCHIFPANLLDAQPALPYLSARRYLRVCFLTEKIARRVHGMGNYIHRQADSSSTVKPRSTRITSP